jgi:hypothetical protein
MNELRNVYRKTNLYNKLSGFDVVRWGFILAKYFIII